MRGRLLMQDVERKDDGPSLKQGGAVPELVARLETDGKLGAGDKRWIQRQGVKLAEAVGGTFEKGKGGRPGRFATNPNINAQAHVANSGVVAGERTASSSSWWPSCPYSRTGLKNGYTNGSGRRRHQRMAIAEMATILASFGQAASKCTGSEIGLRRAILRSHVREPLASSNPAIFLRIVLMAICPSNLARGAPMQKWAP